MTRVLMCHNMICIQYILYFNKSDFCFSLSPLSTYLLANIPSAADWE